MRPGAPFIPIEIISDVLKQLPVKSLIRFQSVCSHWKDLIKSPSFIATHLHHSIRENPSLIFVRCVGYSWPPYFLDRHMKHRHVQDPLLDSLEYVGIAGSCNGLLLARVDPPGTLTSLYLWNPAIREIIAVPRSRSIMDSCHICSLGFAFSTTVNDYKIVLNYEKWCNVDSGFEVYSLTTNSWKKIETAIFKSIYFVADCITLNESIFWVGIKRGLASDGGENRVTVSYDLATEKFRLMPPPPRSGIIAAKLTVYENRLGVFHYSGVYQENTPIDLWVIEEGIGSSWSKILTCDPYRPFPYYVVPVTIWRNQIVWNVDPQFVVLENHKIVTAGSFLFDPTSNEVKVLSSVRFGIHDAVFGYVESLVPIRYIHTGKH
ncbi:unnamed protein product [Cuscuta europaea]|uniref:F-box domain-containing protein n=1 Tax=Cuscuta europaea TaxID=41803 RepID=A0A9P0YLL2_CUSEU|nr:unnamed protein product [Cuscuta europaea]